MSEVAKAFEPLERVERMMSELLDITAELAQAHTREQVAAALVERSAEPIGAHSVVVWTLAPNGAHLELLDSTPNERTMIRSAYRRVAVAGDTPLAAAVRSGERVLIPTLDAYRERFPTSHARLAARPDAHARAAFAIEPITTGGTRHGALIFTFSTPRELDHVERSYISLLARHCGLALERVALLDNEKAARSDVELLYELIASFNRIDDVNALYDLALESVQRGSHSDCAAILLFDDAGVMRFRASRGLSEEYRAAVEGHSPWQASDSFPAPVVVDDAANDPAWATYRAVFEAEGIRALAFVPIVHQRRLIGKFMLYRNEVRPFAPRDLQLTATVAVHVAQAAERKEHERQLATAYRVEREAHLLAEESARAREEILSVVSHDLRNPLGTIVMGATALMTIDAGEKTARVRSIGERIQRQGERMARLIEDLVDFAGIQAGRLALDRGEHRPYEILNSARDLLGPLASERGLRLETDARPNLPAIACDENRAIQVLSSLVSNALKVTPKGGAITVGAETKSSGIVFYVRDTGPGIAAEELPKLFERSWRGKESPYRGTGLGLSIARGIVDAHGGRIWAESQPGIGSTFYFSLCP